MTLLDGGYTILSMEILVIGGTGFFGKRLVNHLLQNGHKVSVLTRGNSPLDFEGQVEGLTCDRNDKEKFSEILRDRFFDVVYDQLCFDYQTAIDACELFKGKTHHFVFTSSQSVYEPGEEIKESAFDPKNHSFTKHETAQSNYAEAKRQAEVGFTEKATFKTSFVRFPIVIGEDDYTGRFKFHVDRIQSGEEIYFPNLEAKMSFIYSDDAGLALKQIGEKGIEGPINCCSQGPLSLNELVRELEKHCGRSLVKAASANDGNHSPYGVEESWYMNNQKAHEHGIQFLDYYELIKKSYEGLK